MLFLIKKQNVQITFNNSTLYIVVYKVYWNYNSLFVKKKKKNGLLQIHINISRSF